jgi:hypothetical protein
LQAYINRSLILFAKMATVRLRLRSPPGGLRGEIGLSGSEAV